MPLFYTHNINESTSLAVWHIREDERFFKEIVISRWEISHPHKRLQHLAGRFLLQILDPDFPVNEILLDGRRPYLPGNSRYFSISHCANFAAAIVSDSGPVGIDVEVATDKLLLIEQRYLNETEQRLIRTSGFGMSMVKRLTSCWSAKESMFKWYALGNVDFREDMIINSLSFNNNSGEMDAEFRKDVNKDLKISFQFFDQLCLAWVY